MKSCSSARRSAARTAALVWGAALGLFPLLAPALHAEYGQATNLWAFPLTVSHNDTPGTPAVAPDGTIYIGDFDGQMHAVGPDGQEQWHFQAGNEIKSSPAIADDGTIYFGSRDRRLYALTPGGKLKWKFATGAWVDSSAAIAADGTVCFGSWDKNFYALNPDGSLKWKFTTGGIVDSSPAIGADGAIYFGAHDKKLYALDAGGKLRWTFLTQAEITSSPALGDDGAIYFSSTDGNLYRLKPDGTEAWRCHTGGCEESSPVLTENGNVAISAALKEVYVSPEGAIVWNFNFGFWIDGTAAVAQDTVCIPSSNRTFWATQTDGTVIWYGRCTNELTSSLVIGNQGQIYLCSERLLRAYQPPSALLPARSAWPMFRANARHTGRVAALGGPPVGF